MSGQSRMSPARGRRRGVIVIVVAAAAFVVLYLAVVALYAANERTVTVRGCTDTPPADAVRLSLTPEAVNAAGNRISANFDIDSLGPLAAEDSGLLADPLTVIVTGTDGPRGFEIAADEIPSPQSVDFITDGAIERWPFDSHTAEFAIVTLHDVDGEKEVVPAALCGSVQVPGWAFASENVAGTDELVIDGEPVTTRSAATVAFGIVILALMVVLPVLGLTVSIAAFRGARKVEATLMSWMAAMLFAVIPLRTFLPGSPPVGSWVDYLVVLWVVAGLVAGLAIYVAAWLRWTPRGGAPVAVASVVVPVDVSDGADGDSAPAAD